jgi:cytosine/adenosine deaminase-related metal-dependent hydrolase
MDMTRPTAVDLLIRHGYLLTMDDEGRLIEDGAVAVAGRDIVDVGPDAVVVARHAATRTIDASGAPVHPGLIECHLHATFHTYRGAFSDRVPEDEIFDQFELPFYDTVNDEEEHLGVVLAALEMIRNGTTCFMEAGTALEPAAAASAAELVGIRALLGDPFIWDRPSGLAQGKETADDGPMRVKGHIKRSPRNLEEALARLGNELRRSRDPDALVRGHIAVIGLGTASEELLLEARRQADEARVVVNMHHGYSPADTSADRARYGRDPLVHLADIGFLERNVTLGHANHLTDEECDVVVEKGTSLAWAPAASMRWGHDGSIRGRHAELWRRGANVALGSDSANWSNSFDLFRQADLALLTARAAHEDRSYLLADDVMRMATRAGARATGLEDRIGSLEVGKRADIVIHTLDRPELHPPTDMLRNLMYASGARTVQTVIVDGRVILEDGNFVALDEQQLLAQVDEASRKLLARMGARVTPDRSLYGPRGGRAVNRGERSRPSDRLPAR